MFNEPHITFSYFFNMRLRRRFIFIIKFIFGYFFGFFLLEVTKQLVFKPLSSNSRFQVETFFEDKLAKHLFNEVKIVCIVITGPANHQKKALHVKKTWGRKCNKLIFFSSQPDLELDTVILNVNESRKFLRQKTKAALVHVHENYIDQFDWVLKADDDR